MPRYAPSVLLHGLFRISIDTNAVLCAGEGI